MSALIQRLSFTPVMVLMVLGIATTSYSAPPVWLSGLGGYSTYKMGDINRDIRNFNAASGASMDEVNSGPAFGLQAGVDITPRFSLAAAFERVFASSEIEYAAGSKDFNLAANAFYGSAQYTVPSNGPFHIDFGAGIGLISAAGQLKVSVGGSDPSVGEVTGSGLLLQGLIGGEYRVAPRIILMPSVGYRMAKISGYEIDGDVLYNPDGSEESMDYSGLVLRFALKFMLNRSM